MAKNDPDGAPPQTRRGAWGVPVFAIARRWRRAVSILRQQRRPVRFIVARLLMLTNLSKWLAIRREGYTLQFFPTSLSAALWIDPSDRRDEERFLRRCLTANDVVVDVGANIGSIALAVATAVGPAGHVLAVEPHPRLFAYLQANIRRNQAEQITAIQCALGAENGQTFLSNHRSDDQNTIKGKGIPVPLRRLDDIAPRQSIAFLKVDVEGYEHFVFAGGRETLRRTSLVYFEYSPTLARQFGAEAMEPWRLIAAAGFELFERTANQLRPAELPPRDKTMLIGIRDSTRFAQQTGFFIAGSD